MSFNNSLSNLYKHRIGKVFKSLFTEIAEKIVVGQPHMLSRLRFVKIIRRQDETEAERLYRTKYEALQKWNNDYWAENNQRFQREKTDYVQRINSENEEVLSHDQLAPFYKDFLERNRIKNIDYNKLWYKLHTRLLISALKAKYSRLRQKFG